MKAKFLRSEHRQLLPIILCFIHGFVTGPFTGLIFIIAENWL